MKKTVRGTVFSERAEESFSMAVNRASEMEEKTDGTALASAKIKDTQTGVLYFFSVFHILLDISA